MNQSKKVLVTGADGGLGMPVVSRLLKAGWHVYSFIHNEKKTDALRQHFADDAPQLFSVVTGDVTHAADIDRALQVMGTPDALVHLAGGFVGAATMAEHEEGAFDQLFNLNTRSTYLLIRALLPLMKNNKGGAIVTIGAKPALHAGAENAVYAASKAAVITLTLSAAEEGRPYQVRANTLVPAVIRTQSNMKWASSEKETNKWTPPEDMAEVICWLISDEGASVTGSVIPLYNQLKS